MQVQFQYARIRIKVPALLQSADLHQVLSMHMLQAPTDCTCCTNSIGASAQACHGCIMCADAELQGCHGVGQRLSVCVMHVRSQCIHRQHFQTGLQRICQSASADACRLCVCSISGAKKW